MAGGRPKNSLMPIGPASSAPVVALYSATALLTALEDIPSPNRQALVGRLDAELITSARQPLGPVIDSGKPEEEAGVGRYNQVAGWCGHVIGRHPRRTDVARNLLAELLVGRGSDLHFQAAITPRLGLSDLVCKIDHFTHRKASVSGEETLLGHWEGETLVVDVTNFTAHNPFRGSGEKLHVVERSTRVDENTILYRFTVEDPETWDKPWMAELAMAKEKGPINEFACHEGNYALANTLRGARVAEAEGAKAAK